MPRPHMSLWTGQGNNLQKREREMHCCTVRDYAWPCSDPTGYTQRATGRHPSANVCVWLSVRTCALLCAALMPGCWAAAAVGHCGGVACGACVWCSCRPWSSRCLTGGIRRRRSGLSHACVEGSAPCGLQLPKASCGDLGGRCWPRLYVLSVSPVLCREDGVDRRVPSYALL